MRLAIINFFLLLQLVFECGAFTLGVSGPRQRIAAQTRRKVPTLYSDTAGGADSVSSEGAATAIPGLIISVCFQFAFSDSRLIFPLFFLTLRERVTGREV